MERNREQVQIDREFHERYNKDPTNRILPEHHELGAERHGSPVDRFVFQLERRDQAVDKSPEKWTIQKKPVRNPQRKPVQKKKDQNKSEEKPYQGKN